MAITRRDFLQATSALAAAWGLRFPEALAADLGYARNGGPSVVWLQAQGCTGCSVSLLNSIYYDTIDNLLLNTFNLDYHSTMMASAGDDAIAAAQAAKNTPGYVLVVEGAIPTAANGEYCYLWPGLTALAGVQQFAQNAGFILAVGTCSAYGGVVAGAPNPTGVSSVQSVLPGKQVINIPGCPSHPDWIVGTIAHIIANGSAPELHDYNRPKLFFERKVHERCPYRSDSQEAYCLEDEGCRGKVTYGDCAHRKWNSPGAGQFGVNWCVGAGSPCQGCTEPSFPDGMSPFYVEVDDDHADGYGSSSTLEESEDRILANAEAEPQAVARESEPALDAVEGPVEEDAPVAGRPRLDYYKRQQRQRQLQEAQLRKQREEAMRIEEMNREKALKQAVLKEQQEQKRKAYREMLEERRKRYRNRNQANSRGERN